MNKQEIYNALDQKASKTMIMDRDGEIVIQGKFCVIAYEGDDTWDIWICNPKDIAKGLGVSKVRNICAALSKTTPEIAWTELNREAWAKVKGTKAITENLVSLGIRRKAVFSEAHLAKMRASAFKKKTE